MLNVPTSCKRTSEAVPNIPSLRLKWAMIVSLSVVRELASACLRPYNHLPSLWKTNRFWIGHYFGWDHGVCVVFKISCPSIVSKQVVVVMFSSCCRLPSFGLCWRLAKTLTCLRLSPARLPPAIPTTTSTSLGKKLIWSFCFSAWKLHDMHERTGAIRSQFASNIASNIFSPAYAGYRMWLKRSIAHRASLFSTSITCAVFLYMCC